MNEIQYTAGSKRGRSLTDTRTGKALGRGLFASNAACVADAGSLEGAWQRPLAVLGSV